MHVHFIQDTKNLIVSHAAPNKKAEGFSVSFFLPLVQLICAKERAAGQTIRPYGRTVPYYYGTAPPLKHLACRLGPTKTV